MQCPIPFLRPARFLRRDTWPSRLGLALVRGVARLPLPWLRGLATVLGWLARGLLVMRRRVAARNLAICFPELDEAARARLLAENLRDSGRMLVEFALAWFGSDAKIAAIPCRVEGLDTSPPRASRAAACCSSADIFPIWNCAHGSSSQRIRISGMYRVMDDPVFEQAVLGARLHYADAMFTKDELRATVKYLRKGGTVWHAPDQDMPRAESVFVPFGVPALDDHGRITWRGCPARWISALLSSARKPARHASLRLEAPWPFRATTVETATRPA